MGCYFSMLAQNVRPVCWSVGWVGWKKYCFNKNISNSFPILIIDNRILPAANCSQWLTSMLCREKNMEFSIEFEILLHTKLGKEGER